MSGLVVQRVPMFSQSTQSVMYRLDLTLEGSISLGVETDWLLLVGMLRKVRTPFLVRLNDDLQELRSVPLPLNVQFERKQLYVGNQYRVGDELFTSGWEVLFQSPRVLPDKVSPMLQVLISLLTCLRRDADLKEVVDAIKIDPVVQYDLVRYLGRAHLGFDYKFTTFEQAVMMMGYRALERWLSTYLLWAYVRHSMPELCSLALTRGRQMELMAQQQAQDETACSTAYITGVFSVVPAIVGVSMEEALRPFDPSDLVVKTLVENTGPLAKTYESVLLAESGLPTKLVQCLRQIDVSLKEAAIAIVESLLFAQQHLKP